MTEGTPHTPQHPGQSGQPGQATPPNQADGYQDLQPGYQPPQAPPAAYPSPQAQPPGFPVTPAAQPYQPYPQQAVPPQGFPQQGSPVNPPKKPKAKKIALILGLVIGLPVLGIGACSAFFYRTFTGPVDEANSFIALLDDKKFDQAINAISSSCRGSLTAADLSQQWQAVEIDGYRLNGVNIVNANATVSGTISVNGEPEDTIEITLVKRDGDWEVCSMTR